MEKTTSDGAPKGKIAFAHMLITPIWTTISTQGRLDPFHKVEDDKGTHRMRGEHRLLAENGFVVLDYILHTREVAISVMASSGKRKTS
jgi:hypothetical protein